MASSSRPKAGTYKKGQPFTFNGEPGWTILSVETAGLVIERKKPDKTAFVPFTSIR